MNNSYTKLSSPQHKRADSLMTHAQTNMISHHGERLVDLLGFELLE
jgi:hypothetical protein